MTVKVLVGDCRVRLAELPAESVHCVVTSVPYWGLRDYGNGDAGIGLESSLAGWLEQVVLAFREVRRVLRSDGTAWLNVGDAYAGSWGNYCSQGRGKGGQRPIIKGSNDPEAYRNHTERPPATREESCGLKPKQRLMLPARLALALQADGWWLRDEVVWRKPNPMPSSVRDRTCPAHEMLYLLTKSARYFYDAEAIKEPISDVSLARLSQPTVDRQRGGPKQDAFEAAGINDRGGSRRPNEIVQSLARKVRRSGNLERKPGSERGAPGAHRSNFGGSIPWEGATRTKRSVWDVPTAPFSEAHFATFPPDLVEPCILAGTSAAGCCSSCGAPRTRQVEAELVPTSKAARTSIVDERDHGADPEDRGSNFRKDGVKQGHAYIVETTGWAPTCSCGAPDGLRADDLELIESPNYDDAGERSDLYADPSIEVGRAGMARPRKPGEGVRPMTRYEQRQYARQLRASPRRQELEAEAGVEAFAHYIRVDRTGARPVPPRLLEQWLERGWLEQAKPVPRWEPAPSRPCVVLDPFGGAGTVGLVAERLQRDSVLVELNPEYAAMACRRIRAEAPLLASVELRGA